MTAVIDKNRIDVITISVYQVVGDTFVGKETDGDIIFECIKKALYANQKVILSFFNIQTITTVFLYSAIGKLYKCFNRDFIKDNLSVADIDNIDLQLLKRVVDTAKAFYPVCLDYRKRANESGKGSAYRTVGQRSAGHGMVCAGNALTYKKTTFP